MLWWKSFRRKRAGTNLFPSPLVLVWSARTGNVTLSDLKPPLGLSLPTAFAGHCQGTTVANEELAFH